jgi:pyruvate-formate lyase
MVTDKIIAFVKWKVIKNYKTTIVGCVAAAMGGVGQYLEQIPQFNLYGRLLVNLSGIIGTLALFFASDSGHRRTD